MSRQWQIDVSSGVQEGYYDHQKNPPTQQHSQSDDYDKRDLYCNARTEVIYDSTNVRRPLIQCQRQQKRMK